jgi:hypothetical protein
MGVKYNSQATNREDGDSNRESSLPVAGESYMTPSHTTTHFFTAIWIRVKGKIFHNNFFGDAVL